MKTLADFKRALTLGSTWEAINYLRPDNPLNLGIRQVSIKQTNRVAFKTPSGNDSWLDFDKADCYEFIDNNIVKCYWGDDDKRLIMQYRLIQGA